jgi:thiamine pyrophosphokinase
MKNPKRLFKSILFLNGDFKLEPLEAILTNNFVTLVAADGAAWKMKNLGLMPDIIVGDLDSLKAQSNYQEVFGSSEIICEGNQEFNDFDKSLKVISDRELWPCLIVGMQGGDLEHSFNNWSVFIRHSHKIELWILEDDRLGLGLCEGKRLIANSPKSHLLSLIPQPRCKLSTNGLRWELKEEELALGLREGARNEILDQNFMIEVEQGAVLVFMSAEAEVSVISVKSGLL